jgi:hypothetical protein
VKAATRKETRGGRRKPSDRRLRCQLCEYREDAVGTIANNRIGSKCLGIVERIAKQDGIALPLSEFTPYKPKKANG